MAQRSKIFEKTYKDDCRQIASADVAFIKDRPGTQIKNNIAQIPFFNQTYQVSGHGIFAMDNEKADDVTSVILAKKLIQTDQNTGGSCND